jgi:hypothetical protein
VIVKCRLKKKLKLTLKKKLKLYKINNTNTNLQNKLRIKIKTDKEGQEDEVSEASKTSDDYETNDDIDSSTADSFTVNNVHSDSDNDKFSEAFSQDLPDSGVEMETDIRTEVSECTVPNLSAEDELLMEINMQLPESDDTLKAVLQIAYQHTFSII